MILHLKSVHDLNYIYIYIFQLDLYQTLLQYCVVFSWIYDKYGINQGNFYVSNNNKIDYIMIHNKLLAQIVNELTSVIVVIKILKA